MRTKLSIPSDKVTADYVVGASTPKILSLKAQQQLETARPSKKLSKLISTAARVRTADAK